MLITTTQNIEGYRITQYLGPVFGEVVTGINFIKDFKAGLSNFFGGRSATYENELVKSRENALREVSERAAIMGANAIVGVAVDYEVLGVNNGMMMIIVSGTAVKFE